jgi:hypothetical protein
MDNMPPNSQARPKKRLHISVHGIGTRGAWQKELNAAAAESFKQAKPVFWRLSTAHAIQTALTRPARELPRTCPINTEGRSLRRVQV